MLLHGKGTNPPSLFNCLKLTLLKDGEVPFIEHGLVAVAVHRFISIPQNSEWLKTKDAANVFSGMKDAKKREDVVAK